MRLRAVTSLMNKMHFASINNEKVASGRYGVLAHAITRRYQGTSHTCDVRSLIRTIAHHRGPPSFMFIETRRHIFDIHVRLWWRRCFIVKRYVENFQSRRGAKSPRNTTTKSASKFLHAFRSRFVPGNGDVPRWSILKIRRKRSPSYSRRKTHFVYRSFPCRSCPYAVNARPDATFYFAVKFERFLRGRKK